MTGLSKSVLLTFAVILAACGQIPAKMAIPAGRWFYATTVVSSEGCIGDGMVPASAVEHTITETEAGRFVMAGIEFVLGVDHVWRADFGFETEGYTTKTALAATFSDEQHATGTIQTVISGGLVPCTTNMTFALDYLGQ